MCHTGILWCPQQVTQFDAADQPTLIVDDIGDVDGFGFILGGKLTHGIVAACAFRQISVTRVHQAAGDLFGIICEPGNFGTPVGGNAGHDRAAPLGGQFAQQAYGVVRLQPLNDANDAAIIQLRQHLLFQLLRGFHGIIRPVSFTLHATSRDGPQRTAPKKTEAAVVPENSHTTLIVYSTSDAAMGIKRCFLR